MEYEVLMTRKHIHATGKVEITEMCTKSGLTEEDIKKLRRLNKQIGYKYLYCAKDRDHNYYTVYEREDKKLSNPLYKVCFGCKITKIL